MLQGFVINQVTSFHLLFKLLHLDGLGIYGLEQ